MVLESTSQSSPVEMPSAFLSWRRRRGRGGFGQQMMPLAGRTVSACQFTMESLSWQSRELQSDSTTYSA
jgi:hypothetical protein